MNNNSRPSRNKHQWCHPRRRLAVERGLSRRHECGPPAGHRRLPRPSDVQNYPSWQRPRDALVTISNARCPEANFLIFSAVKTFECVNEALVHAIGDQLNISYFFSLCVRLTWPPPFGRLVLLFAGLRYFRERVFSGQCFREPRMARSLAGARRPLQAQSP